MSLAATAVAYPFLGEEFLPHFKEYDFLMHWVEKPGTSLEAMNRITLRASRELRAVPGVRNFGAHIGRAEVADEVVGVNFTELWISLDPSVDYEATVARVQAIVDGYPGLQRDLLTYLRERIKEVLTGASATIVVRIFGPDLDVLQRKAAEVGKAVAAVDGRGRRQGAGADAGAADRGGGAAGGGAAARRDARPPCATRSRRCCAAPRSARCSTQQKVFDVVVWGTPRARAATSSRCAACRSSCPAAATRRSSRSPTCAVAPTPNEITREGGSRRIDVTRNVRGRDLGVGRARHRGGARRRAVRRRLSPRGAGRVRARAESQRRLLALGALSLLGILLVLHVDFGSVRLVALVALTIPFALIGGVAGVFLTGGVLSLGSLVGFVTVLGIAARNGIMLVSHYRHLEQEEGVPFGPELVDARRRGAAGADPDDRARHGAGAGADHRRRRSLGPRDRASRWRW